MANLYPHRTGGCFARRLQRSDLDRILNKCERAEAGCLLWNGFIDPRIGYPRIKCRDGHLHAARRVVFAISVRPLEDGEEIFTTCANHARCCEATHLLAKQTGNNAKGLRL